PVHARPPGTHRDPTPIPTRRSSDLRPASPTPPAAVPATGHSSRDRTCPGRERFPDPADVSGAKRPAVRRRLALGGRRRLRSSRRSEEHTSELQSRENLVCRLLLEKK